jgi:hypothetical protein
MDSGWNAPLLPNPSEQELTREKKMIEAVIVQVKKQLR